MNVSEVPLQMHMRQQVQVLKEKWGDEMLAAYFTWPQAWLEKRPILHLVLFETVLPVLDELHDVARKLMRQDGVAMQCWAYTDFLDHLLTTPLCHWHFQHHVEALYGSELLAKIELSQELLCQQLDQIVTQEQRLFREQYLLADQEELPALLSDARERFGAVLEPLLYLRDPEVLNLETSAASVLARLYALPDAVYLLETSANWAWGSAQDLRARALRWDDFLLSLREILSVMTSLGQFEDEASEGVGLSAEAC